MSRTPPEVSLPPGEIRSPDDHRRLKAQLHHQLVAGMDLSVVGTMTKEQLQFEVRRMADDLCQRSSTLLNRSERERLVAKKSIPPEMVDFLGACVQARLNILVSGGTGSGKTTLLNALSAFIPVDERVITIEDAAELRLQQPHVGRLETRPNNAEGVGEVTTRDLVRNALRMRPDRILIGECRGGEALDMLQAMNTGHEGSLTTVHAHDTRDALARLEIMVGMAGFDLPIWVIRRQIASAIHIVVQVSRLLGGARKVVKISEVTGVEGENFVMHDLFAFKQTGLDEKPVAQGYFQATRL